MGGNGGVRGDNGGVGVPYELYGVPYGIYGVPPQVAVPGRAAAGAAVGALWGTVGHYGVPYVVYELYGMLYGIYGVPPPPRWLFRDGLLPEQLWVLYGALWGAICGVCGLWGAI